MKRKLMVSSSVVAGIAYTYNYFANAAVEPEITMLDTPHNVDITQHCPTILEKYYPTFWCYNNHVSSFLGQFRKGLSIEYNRQTFEYPDGGCSYLDYFGFDNTGNNSSICLIIPGINGDTDASSYIANLVEHLLSEGNRCVVFNYRGKAGAPLKTKISYCAAYTDDYRKVCLHINECYPESKMIGIGFSLGSNILLKYMGEEGSNTPLSAGISISNPFDLSKSSIKLASQKLYDKVLTRGAIENFRRISPIYEEEYDIYSTKILNSNSLVQFDESYTRRIFGFTSVEHYYDQGSCIHYLSEIERPVLLVNARDDPIVCEDSIPIDAALENENIILCISSRGGHVGFLEGWFPFSGCWIDRVVGEYVNYFQEGSSV
eukprot:TRINITY_DN7663_c1_g1_i2.p1 TRINITY_DN7663_c1_g1~~TRINITY_DN7663_c1_g1_i2.p1  ORF type:complete len:375 (-),score=54.38 TRINITY_DN7663_c1_g1_i2:157-1281(-)